MIITLDYLIDGNTYDYIYTIMGKGGELVAALSGNDIDSLDIRLFSICFDLGISI